MDYWRVVSVTEMNFIDMLCLPGILLHVEKVGIDKRII
jgi:hypothetical protein